MIIVELETLDFSYEQTELKLRNLTLTLRVFYYKEQERCDRYESPTPPPHFI